MGVLITLGYHQIPQNRKPATLQIPLPKPKRDILSFLGLTVYFIIWIPNYSITANNSHYMRLLEETQMRLYLGPGPS
jgi:hypothetical protein